MCSEVWVVFWVTLCPAAVTPGPFHFVAFNNTHYETNCTESRSTDASVWWFHLLRRESSHFLSSIVSKRASLLLHPNYRAYFPPLFFNLVSYMDRSVHLTVCHNLDFVLSSSTSYLIKGPVSDVKWLWLVEIGIVEYWVVQVTSSALIGC